MAINNAPHRPSTTLSASTRSTNQVAVANIAKPKTTFTLVIQAPDLGSKCAPTLPARTSGAPIPKPSANNALLANPKLPVSAIYDSAQSHASVIHGPTNSADNTPRIAAPPRLPPDWRLLALLSPSRRRAGNCST